jgi:DNA invertase Pin-like site-specific DNA recombinase
MNAVIYCRVSSKEQVDGTSLESQESACREFAVRNGLTIARVFVERGESAKFADRTQLLEMLAYCQRREHDVRQLLVWKVDRLARNVGDHFNIKANLLKLDIVVVSVTEPIDTKPEGKLLETILAGFAQFDNDIRAARTLQGMRRKIQEGISPWRAPLGYKSGIVRGAKKNEPDHPDQPTFRLLQQAWNAFATGKYTKAHVLQHMTMRGLRTRAGKPLSKQSLDYVLSDVYYAGVLRDPWEGKEYMGRHIPMVSRATFDTVQRIIAGRSRSVPHRSNRTEFPLRSLVRCTSCEHPLTGAVSRGRSSVYPYYRCFNRDCQAHESYPSVIVHREFVAFLNAMNKNEHAVAHLKRSILRIWQNREAGNRELKEKRESDAKRVQEQQEQLVRMMMNQLITEREFVAQRTLLASQLSEQQFGISEENAEPEAVLRGLDVICTGLTDLGGLWDGLKIDLKKRFQRIALPDGYVLGQIGTARKGRLFSFLEACDAPRTSLVPLTGQSWNQLAEEINAFAEIFREASSLELSMSQEATAA